MFKVPEWGNDIPKGDGEVTKLFASKSKKKNGKITRPKHKSPANNNKLKEKNINGSGKAKNKIKGFKKLSKDDHINNRILKRNMKLASEARKGDHTETENTTSKNKQNGREFTNGNVINNKMKHRILKPNKKVSNLKSNNFKPKFKDGGKQKNLDTTNIDKDRRFPMKRKHCNTNSSHDADENSIHLQSLNTNEIDEILVNAKRKKLNDQIKDDDVEDVLFSEQAGTDVSNTSNNEENRLVNDVKPQEQSDKKTLEVSLKINKAQKKKDQLKQLLLRKDSNRTFINTSGSKLRQRMLERLKAAQFRYINEKLYTSSGSESLELFKSDPVAFQTYHEGYQQQVKKWPVNPLDLIVKRIQKMPKTHVIADMGCGEAALARRVPQRVRSIDLVAGARGVEACDMARTPLLAASVDAAVYCLSLMGTGLTRYLLEANRVLRTGGHLLIAEVESRIENEDAFVSNVQRLGFSHKRTDSHQVFVFMEFAKVRDAPTKRGKIPELALKPCLYKRR